MDRIGLTFDEFVELKLKPPAGADRAFHEAAEMERREMFPMPLVAAANHLRSRGYDCRPAMLELLVKDGVVKPAGPDAWSQADVDAAADHFEHGLIVSDVVDVYWTGKRRYNVNVTAVNVNDVTFSGGMGDILPAQSTALTMMKQKTIDTDFVGNPAEIEQRATEAVHLVDHDAVDLARLDVGHHAFQRRPIHASAGVAAIVVVIRQALPPLGFLTGDVRLARFALRVQRIEFLLESLLGALARVDGATDTFLGRRGRGAALSHPSPPRRASRARKRGTRSSARP